MRVAAFTKYGREAASTRQRVLQYLPHLAAAGIEVEVHPLLDDAYVRALASGTAASKTAIAAAYARRLRQLLKPQAADLIWVYAELFPWLPASVRAARLPLGQAADLRFRRRLFPSL